MLGSLLQPPQFLLAVTFFWGAVTIKCLISKSIFWVSESVSEKWVSSLIYWTGWAFGSKFVPSDTSKQELNSIEKTGVLGEELLFCQPRILSVTLWIGYVFIHWKVPGMVVLSPHFLKCYIYIYLLIYMYATQMPAADWCINLIYYSQC